MARAARRTRYPPLALALTLVCHTIPCFLAPLRSLASAYCPPGHSSYSKPCSLQPLPALTSSHPTLAPGLHARILPLLVWHLRQAADPRAQEQGRGLGLLPGPSYPPGQDREAAKDEICRAYGSPVDQRQRNSLRQNGVREEVQPSSTPLHFHTSQGFYSAPVFSNRRLTQ